MTIRQYSTYFSCLHDEADPVGHLGRGTHYSIMRSVEWLDVCRTPLPLPQVHDFAVVWDEDHDARVIQVVERMYMAGLLSPVQFIGERKAMLAVIVAAKFRFHGEQAEFKSYTAQVEEICQSVDGDHWTVEIGMFDRTDTWPPLQTETAGIIADSEQQVVTYMQNINNLWNLGTKRYVPPRPSWLEPPPIPTAA